MLNLVGMGADVGGSDPAAEHDSDKRLMVATRGPTKASPRRITHGFILQRDPPPAHRRPAPAADSSLFRPDSSLPVPDSSHFSFSPLAHETTGVSSPN